MYWEHNFVIAFSKVRDESVPIVIGSLSIHLSLSIYPSIYMYLSFSLSPSSSYHPLYTSCALYRVPKSLYTKAHFRSRRRLAKAERPQDWRTWQSAHRQSTRRVRLRVNWSFHNKPFSSPQDLRLPRQCDDTCVTHKQPVCSWRAMYHILRVSDMCACVRAWRSHLCIAVTAERIAARRRL